MLKMKQLREEIKLCLSGMDCFTTTQLKEMLKQKGYVYNENYDVTTFSNAISSLVNQKYILSMDKERKGNYRIVSTVENKNEGNDKLEMQKIRSGENNNELELKKMRREIKEDINEFCLKIEQILDSEKPSTYGRNMKTYNDIIELVNFLRAFEFEVEK